MREEGGLQGALAKMGGGDGAGVGNCNDLVSIYILVPLQAIAKQGMSHPSHSYPSVETDSFKQLYTVPAV